MQAEVIRRLYYCDPSLFDAPTTWEAIEECSASGITDGPESVLEAAECPIDPGAYLQQRSLILALTEVIWRARSDASGPAIVAFIDDAIASPVARAAAGRNAPRTLSVDGVPVVLHADGFTEWVKTYTCPTKAAVAAALEALAPLYTRTDGPGCALLAYSVLLTHKLPAVREKLQTEGPHGLECASLVTDEDTPSSELVHLLQLGDIVDEQPEERSYATGLVAAPSPSTQGHGAAGDGEAGGGSGAEELAGPDSAEAHMCYPCPQFPIWLVAACGRYFVAFSLPKGATFSPEALQYPRAASASLKTTSRATPANCLGMASFSSVGTAGSASPSKPVDVGVIDASPTQEYFACLTVSQAAAASADKCCVPIDGDAAARAAICAGMALVWPAARFIWL